MMTIIHKNVKKRILSWLIVICLIGVTPIKSFAAQSDANGYNDYNHCKTLAQVTKIGSTYFLVDCYHDQILYSSNLSAPMNQWKVMTRDLNKPHGIAGNGIQYLIADTDHHRVLVYEWIQGKFRRTQCLDNIGIRPHYIVYDDVEQAFFVWSSMTGERYLIKKNNIDERMYVSEIRSVEELKNHYVRSFTIAGDVIILPSGTNQQILLLDKRTLQIIKRYMVPKEISGMAQILPIGEYFYMTVSCDESGDHKTATFIRTKDLSLLEACQYEDLKNISKEIRVPYYIDIVDGTYYMTNQDGNKNAIAFQLFDDQFKNVRSIPF